MVKVMRDLLSLGCFETLIKATKFFPRKMYYTQKNAHNFSNFTVSSFPGLTHKTPVKHACIRVLSEPKAVRKDK